MTLSKGFTIPTNRQAPQGDPTVGLPTLLVVDDEQQITASLADQFRRIYNVVTANGGDEALALLKQHDVSVIVADQRMPDMTGAQLLAEARRIDPDIVRILLTGYADIGAVIQAVNEGRIFFYLTKPWQNSELEAIIASAMEHSFLVRENQRLVAALRRINSELEAKVKERTSELEQRALELEKANRKISTLIYLDPLTGIANRRSLDENLMREAERTQRLKLPLSAIMLDVDHFKSFNDTYGHAMGDKMLKAIAETLSRGVRPYDLAARYGGEEFLILLPSTTQKDAGNSAERLRAAISEITLQGIDRKITASFGVATLLPGQPSRTLFERADKSLYHAKTNGRNQVAFEPVDRRNRIDD